MKQKICAVALVGFLGLSLTTPLFASSQGENHRVYPKFKPSVATEAKVITKQSLSTKGKPVSLKKTSPDDSVLTTATGILGEEVAGAKYAIVVGISDYPGTANDLQYADDDAQAMKDVLVEQYGFIDSNITLITDMDATVDAIVDAVTAVKENAGERDEVVFFYSGHGGTGRADDGDAEAIDESIISHDGTNLIHLWDGDLKTLFSGFATSRIVFLFDSCASGGMTDLNESGRIINMATMEKRFDTAVEGVYGGVGAGEFTYHFVIQGMGAGLADLYDHDNVPGVADITIEEAFDYMKANVITDHPTVIDRFANDLLL